MGSRATIYSPLGIPLTDISANVFRSRQIAGPSEAWFEIATNENACKDEFLRFGNILVVEHDTLPQWVGFIDFPREWNDGKVKVNAISAEIIMDWRMCLPTLLEGYTASNCIRAIIAQCNQWPGLKLFEGSIDDANAGPARNWVIGGKASDMMLNTNAEWDITAAEVGGVLRLYVNAYKSMGVSTRFVLDETNSKNTSPKLTENGPILNYLFVVASAATANAQNYIEIKDDYSIARYGLRQYIFEMDNLSLSDLQVTADGRLSAFKDVTYTATPTVLDVGSAFLNIRLGNRIGWSNAEAGFNGSSIGAFTTMRIIGYEYDEATNQCGLVAKTNLLNPPEGMFSAETDGKIQFFTGQ